MANNTIMEIGITGCNGVDTHVKNGHMVRFKSEDGKSYVVNGPDAVIFAGIPKAGIHVPAHGPSAEYTVANGKVGHTYYPTVGGCLSSNPNPPGIIID
jgi:hypothetical protein